MTETWANESALERAREVLAARYPGEHIEILETFDLAYVGWECDFRGALITRGGVPELVLIDETGGDDRPVTTKLRERLIEYRRLIVETDRVLRRWMSLRAERADPAAALKALEEISDVPPEPGDEMPDDIAAAVEREVTLPLVVAPEGLPDSAAERLQQLADAPGGRVVLDVGDLTPEEIELIAHSEVSDEVVPEKLEPFDMQAALGLSDRDWVLMRTKWVVVSDIRRMLEEAGIDAVALAVAAGEDAAQVERWLRGVVRHVSLDTLTVLYAVAAEKAEWPDLEWLIRGLPESSE